jgi:hypothetical protein
MCKMSCGFASSQHLLLSDFLIFATEQMGNDVTQWTWLVHRWPRVVFFSTKCLLMSCILLSGFIHRLSHTKSEMEISGKMNMKFIFILKWWGRGNSKKLLWIEGVQRAVILMLSSHRRDSWDDWGWQRLKVRAAVSSSPAHHPQQPPSQDLGLVPSWALPRPCQEPSAPRHLLWLPGRAEELSSNFYPGHLVTEVTTLTPAIRKRASKDF